LVLVEEVEVVELHEELMVEELEEMVLDM